MSEQRSIQTGRGDGRCPDELRPVTIQTAINPYAEGSVEVSFGKTRVLCCASVETETPEWMKGDKAPTKGWITAEYGMLPRSTHSRNRREAVLGKQSGRTQEIQRLIGRALRRSIDLKAIPGVTIRLDCDVVVADGGTRTAAITGSWVALAMALRWAHQQGVIAALPEIKPIAAISVGMVSGSLALDLDYSEDSTADFDLNIVADGAGRLIEVQGTGEQSDLSRQEFIELIDLGLKGVQTLVAKQQAALS